MLWCKECLEIIEESEKFRKGYCGWFYHDRCYDAHVEHCLECLPDIVVHDFPDDDLIGAILDEEHFDAHF